MNVIVGYVSCDTLQKTPEIGIMGEPDSDYEKEIIFSWEWEYTETFIFFWK